MWKAPLLLGPWSWFLPPAVHSSARIKVAPDVGAQIVYSGSASLPGSGVRGEAVITLFEGAFTYQWHHYASSWFVFRCLSLKASCAAVCARRGQAQRSAGIHVAPRCRCPTLSQGRTRPVKIPRRGPDPCQKKCRLGSQTHASAGRTAPRPKQTALPTKRRQSLDPGFLQMLRVFRIFRKCG